MGPDPRGNSLAPPQNRPPAMVVNTIFAFMGILATEQWQNISFSLVAGKTKTICHTSNLQDDTINCVPS